MKNKKIFCIGTSNDEDINGGFSNCDEPPIKYFVVVFVDKEPDKRSPVREVDDVRKSDTAYVICRTVSGDIVREIGRGDRKFIGMAMKYGEKLTEELKVLGERRRELEEDVKRLINN